MITTSERSDTQLDDLRETRHALRLEIAQVGHWRRVLRARTDLTVARAAAPAALQTDARISALVSVEGLPRPRELERRAEVPARSFALSDLPELRRIDERLERYEIDLRRALMTTTDRLVQLLADEPATVDTWSAQTGTTDDHLIAR